LQAPLSLLSHVDNLLENPSYYYIPFAERDW
jgi:hypothetical protein